MDSIIKVPDLMEFWNDNRGALPLCRILSQGRIDKIKVQLRKYPDWDHWAEAIEAFTSSSFCRDQWKPGFDEFLTESKRIRAIEGMYADRPMRMAR